MYSDSWQLWILSLEYLFVVNACFEPDAGRLLEFQSEYGLVNQ